MLRLDLVQINLVSGSESFITKYLIFSFQNPENEVASLK